MSDKIRKGEFECDAPVLSAASIDKVIETFEKEEKKKAGKNILSQYSDFQVNKVPEKKSDLTKFP